MRWPGDLEGAEVVPAAGIYPATTTDAEDGLVPVDMAKSGTSGSDEEEPYLACVFCKVPVIHADDLISERADTLTKAVYAYELDSLICERDCWCYSATNTANFRYDVVRVRPSAHGICIRGKPVAEFSWFPPYAARMAFCGSCSEQLGWSFVAASESSPEVDLSAAADETETSVPVSGDDIPASSSAGVVSTSEHPPEAAAAVQEATAEIQVDLDMHEQEASEASIAERSHPRGVKRSFVAADPAWEQEPSFHGLILTKLRPVMLTQAAARELCSRSSLRADGSWEARRDMIPEHSAMDFFLQDSGRSLRIMITENHPGELAPAQAISEANAELVASTLTRWQRDFVRRDVDDRQQEVDRGMAPELAMLRSLSENRRQLQDTRNEIYRLEAAMREVTAIAEEVQLLHERVQTASPRTPVFSGSPRVRQRLARASVDSASSPSGEGLAEPSSFSEMSSEGLRAALTPVPTDQGNSSISWSDEEEQQRAASRHADQPRTPEAQASDELEPLLHNALAQPAIAHLESAEEPN